jgi:3-deoxy-D-manno-octulosonic-acid transferase
MIEPAAYGANVAFGPNTVNFRDICEILLAGGGATRIDSLEQILPWIGEQLAQPELGSQRGRRAQELVKKHQGALAKTVELLQAIIEEGKNEPASPSTRLRIRI